VSDAKVVGIIGFNSPEWFISNVAHFSFTVVPQSAVSPFSIINWWHEYQVKFPKLAVLARTLLSVPASSAASERAFSAAVSCSQRYNVIKDAVTI